MFQRLVQTDRLAPERLHIGLCLRRASRQVAVGVEYLKVGELGTKFLGLGFGDNDLWPKFGDSAHDLAEGATFRCLFKFLKGALAPTHLLELARDLPI